MKNSNSYSQPNCPKSNLFHEQQFPFDYNVEICSNYNFYDRYVGIVSLATLHDNIPVIVIALYVLGNHLTYYTFLSFKASTFLSLFP